MRGWKISTDLEGSLEGKYPGTKINFEKSVPVYSSQTNNNTFNKKSPSVQSTPGDLK